MCELTVGINWCSNQLMNDCLDFQLLNNRGWLKMQKAIKTSDHKVLESGIADIKCAIQSFCSRYPEKKYYIAKANLVDALNLKDEFLDD